MFEERAYWLVWSQISGVGPVLLQRLQQHFGSLEVAWNATVQELGQVDGFGIQTVQKVVKERTAYRNPANFWLEHQEQNPNLWTPADVEYPRLLLETASPPPILYYRGIFSLEENLGQVPLVGIVGTRHPSEYGIRWTRQITTLLVKNGFTIVSGLAEGIDTESHTAAIKSGGRTLAVVGTGVDVIYPAKNRDLYRQILTQGLVLSEYASKTPPDKTHFPRRNRIIAGLCRAVLVLEAPLKSGALITADYANEFGRDVYALPGRLDDSSLQGCLKLLSQGAIQIPQDLDELIKMLGAIPQINFVPESVIVSALPQLSPELQKIIDAMTSLSRANGVEAVPLDLIIQEVAMPAGSVSAFLLELELMGLILQLPGMRYQKC
ncbi:DNA-processing protein DprA [Calothrix sp. PCC 6303]|uniref:DNA-processing protein DprA n=1 Tax=Calothrix sp. PCC 6303 TaxID=1170562 RepID=UPI0002A02C1C|nr:DNA-processing protein DprA [Calothrix sp. PCC 6303]AFZ01197.1 DNA protecting protein DprA [Calothrix sp. PCC 6303]